MTGKDLLDSLRFVDDDLIEEAGLEQLKEDKQKKTKGKVIFLRTALTAAAGICIFTAGTVMGRKITAKSPTVSASVKAEISTPITTFIFRIFRSPRKTSLENRIPHAIPSSRESIAV